MLRTATLALTLFLALPASAQPVTVETLVAPGSAIDDGLVIGPDGALYGSRFGGFPTPIGETVTRVDPADGSTSIYADGFARANGLAFAPGGDLFVANYNSGEISRVTPNGTLSVYAAADNTVSGVAFDVQSGLLYVASYDGEWVRSVTAAGVFEDVITDGLNGPAGLAFDDQNRLHVVNFDDGKLFRIDGTTLVPVADLQTAVGFIAYGGGRFFATGINANRVYAVEPSGDITVLAGTGAGGTVDGPGDTAQFNGPNGIAATAAGDTLFVSDARSRAVRRLLVTPPVSTEAAPETGGALLPASPNPFGAATSVRVRLDAPADIEVTLHDVLGRRLRHLAAGAHPAGLHAVPLRADGLAPGTYLVRLRHGGTVETRLVVRR